MAIKLCYIWYHSRNIQGSWINYGFIHKLSNFKLFFSERCVANSHCNPFTLQCECPSGTHKVGKQCVGNSVIAENHQHARQHQNRVALASVDIIGRQQNPSQPQQSSFGRSGFGGRRKNLFFIFKSWICWIHFIVCWIQLLDLCLSKRT